MDIFINSLTNSADILFSFFTNIVTSPQNEVWDFLMGNSSFDFTSFLGNQVSFDLVVSFLPVDFIRDAVVNLVQILFTPLPFLWEDYYSVYALVPFYFCFISFFINSLIIVAIFKVIKLFT